MMSQIVGALGVLLFALAACQAETVVRYETNTQKDTYGPVTMVVDNLAEIAVNVSDNSTAQLQAKMDRTERDIAGNMEVLTANAVAQLSDVIFQTNELLVANPDCNPAWSLDELNENVTAQLSTCTANLEDLLKDFRVQSQQAMSRVQGFVQQIAELPAKCQMVGASSLNPLASAGAHVCFINGMAEVNVGMAQSMHSASVLLVQTHQAAADQEKQAQQCSGAVVQQVGDYLREEQDQCQS
ncbi:uncharacterized protein LOC110186728 [Drosophila serrata]|uniref:uncharacterized protein LOC110186728 n=1 Tax=Drosophila serrata TaxID=7274 RepID=UPI000A1D2D14|nr:uncharacterized protein LOC110186728 [Drosophila serrata]